MRTILPSSSLPGAPASQHPLRDRLGSLLDRFENRLLAVVLLLSPRSPSPWTLANYPEPGKQADRGGGGGVPKSWGKETGLLASDLPPLLKEWKEGVGRVETVDIREIMPDTKYRPRYEILDLMDRGFIALCGHFRKTSYFVEQKERHGSWNTVKKLVHYYRLLRSMQTEGPLFDIDSREHLPFMLLARGTRIRLDGAHRSSVARFLGYEEIPALIVTPGEVLSLPGLQDRTASVLRDLAEADC